MSLFHPLESSRSVSVSPQSSPHTPGASQVRIDELTRTQGTSQVDHLRQKALRSMAILKTRDPDKSRVRTVAEYLAALSNWQDKYAPGKQDEGYLSQLWYRGVNQWFPNQVPGVYRNPFTVRAEKLDLSKTPDLDAKRLHLEREIVSQFRTAGAVFLKGYSPVEIYFAAQHFRTPTRLLDWSTNPLAALFFACDGGKKEEKLDGFVYAMDARRIIDEKAEKRQGERLYQSVMTMRHPYVRYATGLAFWSPVKEGEYRPWVLPVRPDVVPGRIGQQSSAFTLHMHNAPDAENETLLPIGIKAESKPDILDELHRMNINQFTTYYDLDHLSAELKARWGVGG